MSTAISWTNETWNPVVGCEPVSPGCDNCYAKQLHDMRHRAHLAGKKMLPQYHVPFETVQLIGDRIEQPLHWRAPRKVFVNSVSDLFHRHVKEDFLDRVFAVMAVTRRHTYQVLTKRPHRAKAYLSDPARPARIDRAVMNLMDADIRGRVQSHRCLVQRDGLQGWPLPNVWLGASVENQACADKRIPMLLDTPAAVRFLSCEPLLGPLDLSKCLLPLHLEGAQACRGVHWVIVGGESGDNRRTVDIQWMRDIVDQCRRHDVPVFMKQDSAYRSEQRGRIPDDLWIREYPIALGVTVP